MVNQERINPLISVLVERLILRSFMGTRGEHVQNVKALIMSELDKKKDKKTKSYRLFGW